LGKAYGLNTQVLLANLQHFCSNNNIIILNYYYFIPGLFPSHSWWAESCSVRLSRGMVCSRQPRSFQGVHPHGRPDGWTEDRQRTDDGTHGFKGGILVWAPCIMHRCVIYPVEPPRQPFPFSTSVLYPVDAPPPTPVLAIFHSGSLPRPE